MELILREADVLCAALRFSNPGVLTRLQSALKAQGVKAEWTPREQLHCTLLTSDIVDDRIAERLLPGLSLPIAFSAEGVRLEVWNDEYLVLVLDPGPGLARLQTSLYNRAYALGLNISQYAPPGVYKPHVTLGTLPAPVDLPTDLLTPTERLYMDEVAVWNGDYRQVDAARLPRQSGDPLFIEVSGMTRRLVARGGPGSGHFGHEGRPGEVGGSLPSDFHSAEPGPPGNNPWSSSYHKPDGILDMDAVGRDVARAVAERPSRESHGRTAINAFFLVNGTIYPWDKWETIPPDEKTQAIAVHSHSSDNWREFLRKFGEGKPENFQPLNSGDVAILFRNFEAHRMGPASIIILGDGRMESLEILPNTDAAAVKMREKKLDGILHRDYAGRSEYYEAHKHEEGYNTYQQDRELLHQFAEKYGLGYQTGRWRDNPLTAVERSSPDRPPKKERQSSGEGWRAKKTTPDLDVDRSVQYLAIDLPETFVVEDVEEPTDWHPEISNPLDGDKERLLRWLAYNLHAYKDPDGWDMLEVGERAGAINRIPTPENRKRMDFLRAVGRDLEQATLCPQMVALSEAVTAMYGGLSIPRSALVQGDPDATIEVLAKGKTISGVIGQMSLSDWAALTDQEKRRLLGEFYMADAGLETGGLASMLAEITRVIYYDTQDVLAREGFARDSKLRLYRGLVESPDQLLPGDLDGGWVNVEISNLSPWTFSPGVAAEYATEQDRRGSILAMDVPASMVFCNWETGPASRRWLSYLLLASREPMKAYLYPVQRARVRHG